MSAGPGQPGRPARGAGQGSGTPRWHTAARPPDAHGAGQSETPPLLTAGRRRRRRGRRRYATERRCVPLTTVTDTADGAHSRQYFGTGKGPALGRQGVDGRRARARRAAPARSRPSIWRARDKWPLLRHLWGPQPDGNLRNERDSYRASAAARLDQRHRAPGSPLAIEAMNN